MVQYDKILSWSYFQQLKPLEYIDFQLYRKVLFFMSQFQLFWNIFIWHVPLLIIQANVIRSFQRMTEYQKSLNKNKS